MSTESEQLLAQAGNNLATKLGLPEGAVFIGTGDKAEGGFPSIADNKDTHIVIKTRGLGADLNQAEAEKKILEALHHSPAMRAVVETQSNAEQTAEVVAKLQHATQGTDFDQHILKSSIFNPEIAKKDYEIRDYAVQGAGNSPVGTELSIHIPADDKVNPKEFAKKIETNIKSRLPEIQQSLAENTIKYVTKNLQHEGKSEAEIASKIAEVQTNMAKLEITTTVEGGEFSIAIRSPEQKKIIADGLFAAFDKSAELKATNPLNLLSETVTQHELDTNSGASSQLNKAISRAVLYAGGEKAMEVFPIIAGKKDVANAIKKEAKRFPEKEHAFHDILNSELFKTHSKEHPEPAKPIFKKNPEHPDTLELWINIPKDKVKHTVEVLAHSHEQHNHAEQAQHEIQVQPAPQAVAPEANDTSVMADILAKLKETLTPSPSVDEVAHHQSQAANQEQFQKVARA